MARGRWWQVPRLHTEGDHEIERRVSWLELFYDLVFVVVIAEVAHYLALHLSLGGLAGYLLLFMAVWWAWIGGTFYNERFETTDVSYRLITFLQMIPVASMAIFASDGLGATSNQFILSYVAVRTIILVLWTRAGLHEPRFWPVSQRYLVGFGLSIVLLILSTQIAPPWRFGIWAVALLIDVFTPASTAAAQRRLPRFSRSKLPERFGLFVLIVLGETIVGAISGVAAQHDITLITGAGLSLGLALAFSLWWIYFDFIARRAPHHGFWWSFAWNYLHLPLVMSIAAIGAGVLILLEGEATVEGYALIAGALAFALADMALLELTLDRSADEPTNQRISVSLKVLAAALVLVIAPFTVQFGVITFLASLLPPMLLPMVYGAYAWFSQNQDPSEELLKTEAA